jgi:hypothetical protein
MGKHAVIGNSQVGHKNISLKLANAQAQNRRITNAPLMAGVLKVTTFDHAEAFIATLAPMFVMAPGQGMVSRLERGTTWRKVMNSEGKPSGNESLRVSTGLIELTKVSRSINRVRVSAWVATYTPFGGKSVTVDAQMIVKGQAPVKDSVRSVALNRVLLGR